MSDLCAKESAFMPSKSLSKFRSNKECESSLEHIDESQAKESSTKNRSETDFLGLLDISHLLEYQSQSQLTSNLLFNGTSASNSATNILGMTPSSTSNASTSSILRGGHVDALIVLATSANSTVIAPPLQASPAAQHDFSHRHQHHTYSSHTLNSTPTYLSTMSTRDVFPSTSISHLNPYQRKKNNFLFQEAFLTTYRTILEPIDLIRKLIHRYRLFARSYRESLVSMSSIDEKDAVDSNEKFDFDLLNVSNRREKMAFSATRNSLTLLIRVLDGIE